MGPERRREWQDRLISAATGGLAAWLAAALLPFPEPREPEMPAFKVSLATLDQAAAAAPALATPPAPAVQSEAAEPVKPQIEAPLPAPPAPEPEPAPPAPEAPPAEVAVPPPPDDDAPLPPPGVRPGGNTLILAAKVDHTGTVLDLKILVPSGDAISNLTYGLALQARPLRLNPPVPEGQTRWIEVRADFVNNDSVLP